MKKILILLTLFSNMIFSAHLRVSSSAGIPIGTDGNILLYPLSATFSNLEVSSSNQFIEIPIYVKSDSTEAVFLTINNILPLTHNGETIPFSLSYRGNGISSGVAFPLLTTGEGGRDGNTVVGTIRISIPSVGVTQIEGSYVSNMSMALSSSNYVSSSSETFSIGATVPLVAIAGFNATSAFTTGQKFVGDSINYGTFSFNQKNIIDKNLFVKSNSIQDFTISFDTSELISQVDPSYVINMKYYFKGIQFTNNQKFTALTGVNEGVSSIGNIRFETQTIDGSLIAGSYQATVNVTVRLE